MASKSCSFVLGMIIGLSLCMPPQSVLAQEPFYKGKSIRFLLLFLCDYLCALWASAVQTPIPASHKSLKN